MLYLQPKTQQMKFPWNTAHHGRLFCCPASQAIQWPDLEHGCLWNKNGSKATQDSSSESIWKGKEVDKKNNIPKSHNSPFICTVVCESMVVDERHTDSTFSQEVHVGEVISYPNPLLPPNKIRGRHRECQERWQRAMKPRKCEVITVTHRTSLA